MKCSAVPLFLQTVSAHTALHYSIAEPASLLPVSVLLPAILSEMFPPFNIVAGKTVHSAGNGWKSLGTTSGHSAVYCQVYLLSKVYAMEIYFMADRRKFLKM